MTLYEINNEIYSLVKDAVDPETGEINEELYGRLEAMQAARDEKLENIGLLIKNLTAEAKACKEEAKAFSDRAKSCEGRAEWLKGYMDQVLQGQAFKTDRLQVSYRKSQVVEIDSGTLLDEEYLRFKDPEPDKVKIKEALKAGEVIDGCRLVDKLNMSIK